MRQLLYFMILVASVSVGAGALVAEIENEQIRKSALETTTEQIPFSEIEAIKRGYLVEIDGEKIVIALDNYHTGYVKFWPDGDGRKFAEKLSDPESVLRTKITRIIKPGDADYKSMYKKMKSQVSPPIGSRNNAG
ncbi:hypothetical protein ACFLY0_01875 [Patescibacteria group bacterium]